jgi:hypothetical protein
MAVQSRVDRTIYKVSSKHVLGAVDESRARNDSAESSKTKKKLSFNIVAEKMATPSIPAQRAGVHQSLAHMRPLTM